VVMMTKVLVAMMMQIGFGRISTVVTMTMTNAIDNQPTEGRKNTYTESRSDKGLLERLKTLQTDNLKRNYELR
jgi:hypothetical protein